MTITAIPQLAFTTNAKEAMTYYATILGGKVSFTYLKDLDPTSATPDLVAHAVLTSECGITIYASDDCMTGGSDENIGSSRTDVALVSDDHGSVDHLTGVIEAFAAEGTMVCPVSVQPWGGLFGCATDKYGNTWMVNLPAS
ncbi:hypothetical protein [Bowdeniella massiliensis]|uniref:hypothetical protein n=1 Tax=Bowdeniella massiliensis TaxID=2932264 RepID=UPI0020294F45|nr:hypothetical protein [Bowdeniella massiliensis]